MDKSIKIFMCCHKEFDLLPPLTVPVMGGASLGELIPGCLPDYGAGGSISEKNPEYCELTVQYYAWKNEDADYYGFCHYRRFFCIDESIKRPYLVFKDIPKRRRARLLGDESKIQALCQSYDVILPRAEDVGLTVYEKYVTAPACFEDDLKLFIELIKERLPEYGDITDEYMAGRKQYFCNMFIMKRELFFEYCEALFPLLFEFDERKVRHGGFQEDRTNGYLAERFLGIFVENLRRRGTRITELARIDTRCDLKKRITTRLFPPEGRIRLLSKKILKHRR